MTKTEEREQAFILLFEKSFNEEIECDKLLNLALESEIITDSPFTVKLFKETFNNVKVIDEIITKYSKGWALSRISKVALAVLRIAVCEIKYFDNIPVAVSINEAVNLCKKYASEDEYSFVNGILGSIAKGED